MKGQTATELASLQCINKQVGVQKNNIKLLDQHYVQRFKKVHFFF